MTAFPGDCQVWVPTATVSAQRRWRVSMRRFANQRFANKKSYKSERQLLVDFIAGRRSLYVKEHRHQLWFLPAQYERPALCGWIFPWPADRIRDDEWADRHGGAVPLWRLSKVRREMRGSAVCSGPRKLSRSLSRLSAESLDRWPGSLLDARYRELPRPRKETAPAPPQ